MAGLSEIGQIRKVEWGATYLWDIYFPDAPYPFNDWFPASNVSEPLIQPMFESQSFGLIKLDFPKNTGALSMSITFYDDVNLTLETWLREWYNKIFNDFMHVTPLYDCLKDVQVRRLDRGKNIVSNINYSVVPNTPISVESNSNASARQLTVGFSVAGFRQLAYPSP